MTRASVRPGLTRLAVAAAAALLGGPAAVRANCPWDCGLPATGVVDVTDLLAVLAQYDTAAPVICDGGACDFDGNGCVDVSDLLKLLGQWNQVCPGDALFFTDPEDFFAALAAAEKTQKFFWDFNPHDQQQFVPGLNDPLDINTHGANLDDPWTDAAGNNLWPPEVDNVQFSSNTTPQGPLTPQGVFGLAFLHPGNWPIANNALVANFFVDSFDIVSGPPAGDNHTAFALELVATSFRGAVETVVHVTVYDKADIELGKFDVPVFGKAFLGILTKDNELTIGRIDIWDQSGLAEGVSSIMAFRNVCGPGSGPCDQPHGTPGCDIPECCRRVCEIDPFCCDVQWDQICADEADLFPQCNPFGCSDNPDNGPCCIADGTPFCEDADCCRRVCAIDPFCCDVAWDSICADEAATFPQCGCPPPNVCDSPGTCLDGYVQCGIGSPFNCICFTIDNDPAQGGSCIQDFFCGDVAPCPGPGQCPPGFVCVTGSCCGIDVCAPIIKCEKVEGANDPPIKGSGRTGSGDFIMPPNSHTNQGALDLDEHTNQGAHTNQDLHTNQDGHTNQD